MKKAISLITTFAMVMTLFAGIMPANAEEPTIKGKVIESIEFGTYPQTEIVGEANQSGANNRQWAAEGDYIIDQTVYAQLQEDTDWSNDDKTINDVKYHRALKGSGISEGEAFFNWENDSTYHYFRYEPIKWRVLDINGDDAFLLADIALDSKKYNDTYTDVTWETATIRSWLNGEFENRAFSSDEQSAIIQTVNVNANNSQYSTSGGNNTTDSIFLLSESELSGTAESIKYGFKSGSDRKTYSSTYAKATGTYADVLTSDKRVCNWWLRTPGGDNRSAMYSSISGECSKGGSYVTEICSIRPVLHIDLKKDAQYSINYKEMEIEENDVKLSKYSYDYDATSKEPVVEIDGAKEDIDFTVEYLNNTNPGTAQVKITGISGLKGTVIKKFDIVIPGKDSTTPLNRSVNYDLIEFGSYPQTEIVAEARQSGAYDKGWSADSYVVDASLYTSLTTAAFDDNEDTVIAGTKYHRITRSDAVWTKEDWGGYYNWPEKDTSYHYFRYEPIKWRVLNLNDNDAFLLADICLDTQKYNSEIADVTWETSSIREWLNASFYNRAFTADEKNAIIETTLKNEKNIKYSTGSENDTKDNVFLMSESEVMTADYGFSSSVSKYDKAKLAKSSTYAKAMGVCSPASSKGNCNWWTRTSGAHNNCAAFCSGTFTSDGYTVDFCQCAVRPALHIDWEATDAYKVNGTTGVLDVLKIEDFSIGSDEFLFNGKAIEPEVVIEGLIKDKDYSVSYSNNDKLGLATVTVTGMNKWSGTIKKNFAIVDEVNMSYVNIEIAEKNITYNGRPCCPNVDIKGLVNGEDYTVSYKNNIEAGTGTVIVTGNEDNGYTGTKEKTFTINPADISDMEVILGQTECTYDGSPQTPKAIVDGLNSKNYTVEYKNNTDVGTAKVIIKGKAGNYSGTIEKTFTINPANIAGREVTLTPSEYEYDGNEKRPSVTVAGLESSDYTVSYKDNTEPGKATVTITGKGNYQGTINGTFVINPKDIKDAATMYSEYPYSGSAIEPQIVLNGRHLEKNEDYIIIGAVNNIETGTATLFIKGIGKYTGYALLEFEISRPSLEDAYIDLGDDESAYYYTYTGEEIEPEILGVYLEGELVDEDEYTLSYENNVNVSDFDEYSFGKIIATAKEGGKFTGSTEQEFAIMPASLEDAETAKETYSYTGSAVEPEIKVNGRTLEKDKDYTITCEDNIEMGDNAKAHIEGIGNYTDSKDLTFKIGKANLEDATVKLNAETFEYTGSEITPEVTSVEIDGNVIDPNNYTVTYSDNIDVTDAAKVTVTAKEGIDITGTIDKTFTITRAVVTVPEATSGLVYDGSEKTGVETDTGYTVTGNKATDAGTYTAIATLDENYEWADETTADKEITWSIAKATITAPEAVTGLVYDGSEKAGVEAGIGYTLLGTASATNAGSYMAVAVLNANCEWNDANPAKVIPWSIAKADIESSSISLETSEYTYSGKAKNPAVTVTGISSDEYTVSYSNNIKCGTATATVSANADSNYTGAITTTFRIIPAKASISKATAGKKSITVSIKSQKTSGVTGYEISYAKSGSKAKTIKVSSTSKKLTGLTKGKKYTVKVRAYVTINDEKVYGAYSAAKTVKVK